MKPRIFKNAIFRKLHSNVYRTVDLDQCNNLTLCTALKLNDLKKKNFYVKITIHKIN